MAEHTNKKRAVISYDNMSQELLDAFREKYPHGYADYMGDIFRVDKPNGDFFYAVSLEVPDAIYLVKINVKIDDYQDLENDLYKDDDRDEEDDEQEADDRFPEPDDDIAAAKAAEADDDE